VGDRIVLDQKLNIGKDVLIEGPPLEALRCQRGRAGSLITLTDSEGNDFRGRVLSISDRALIFIFEAFPAPTESSAPSGSPRKGTDGADHPEGDRTGSLKHRPF